jgi:hypothetical protein
LFDFSYCFDPSPCLVEHHHSPISFGSYVSAPRSELVDHHDSYPAVGTADYISGGGRDHKHEVYVHNWMPTIHFITKSIAYHRTHIETAVPILKHCDEEM